MRAAFFAGRPGGAFEALGAISAPLELEDEDDEEEAEAERGRCGEVRAKGSSSLSPPASVLPATFASETSIAKDEAEAERPRLIPLPEGLLAKDMTAPAAAPPAAAEVGIAVTDSEEVNEETDTPALDPAA